MSAQSLAYAVLTTAVKEDARATREGFWSLSHPMFIFWCTQADLDPQSFLERLYAKRARDIEKERIRLLGVAAQEFAQYLGLAA